MFTSWFTRGYINYAMLYSIQVCIYMQVPVLRVHGEHWPLNHVKIHLCRLQVQWNVYLYCDYHDYTTTPSARKIWY